MLFFICYLQIYEFNAGSRRGPGEYTSVDYNSARGTEGRSKASKKDFAWLLARLPNVSDPQQTVPGWTGFNMVANKHDIPPRSVVGYSQMIDASPTELSTVYTLQRGSMAWQLDSVLRRRWWS